MVRGGNNHASPTGALPFLLPGESLLPVSVKGLEGWVLGQGQEQRQRRGGNSGSSTDVSRTGGKSVRGGGGGGRGGREGQSRPMEDDSRMDVYRTLITGPIRRAWLYTLYLSASPSPPPPSSSPSSTNHGSSKNTLQTLYINPSTRNPFVRTFLEYQLRGAAIKELLNAPEGARVVDVERLHRDAERAWEALSVVLGGREWFEMGGEGSSVVEEDDEEEDDEVDGAVNVEAKQKRRNQKEKHLGNAAGNGGDGDEPSLFDAEIFSYTYLILDPRMGIVMTESPLARGLLRHENLVAHRRRILERYFYEEED